MVWCGFAIENAPASFETLAASFPAFLVAGCWVAASLGNVDDRSHREMATAAAGSATKLHRARALASACICIIAAVLQAGYAALALSQPDVSAALVFLICLLTLVGAISLGVAIGSWLHEPLLGGAFSVLIGFVAVIAIVLMPPVQQALQSIGNGTIGPALALATITIALGSALGWMAGVRAQQASPRLVYSPAYQS